MFQSKTKRTYAGVPWPPPAPSPAGTPAPPAPCRPRPAAAAPGWPTRCAAARRPPQAAARTRRCRTRCTTRRRPPVGQPGCPDSAGHGRRVQHGHAFIRISEGLQGQDCSESRLQHREQYAGLASPCRSSVRRPVRAAGRARRAAAPRGPAARSARRVGPAAAIGPGVMGVPETRQRHRKQASMSETA